MAVTVARKGEVQEECTKVDNKGGLQLRSLSRVTRQTSREL